MSTCLRFLTCETGVIIMRCQRVAVRTKSKLLLLFWFSFSLPPFPPHPHSSKIPSLGAVGFYSPLQFSFMETTGQLTLTPQGLNSSNENCLFKRNLCIGFGRVMFSTSHCPEFWRAPHLSLQSLFFNCWQGNLLVLGGQSVGDTFPLPQTQCYWLGHVAFSDGLEGRPDFVHLLRNNVKSS